jgi:hypothetical protein
MTGVSHSLAALPGPPGQPPTVSPGFRGGPAQTLALPTVDNADGPVCDRLMPAAAGRVPETTTPSMPCGSLSPYPGGRRKPIVPSASTAGSGQRTDAPPPPGRGAGEPGWACIAINLLRCEGRGRGGVLTTPQGRGREPPVAGRRKIAFVTKTAFQDRVLTSRSARGCSVSSAARLPALPRRPRTITSFPSYDSAILVDEGTVSALSIDDVDSLAPTSTAASPAPPPVRAARSSQRAWPGPTLSPSPWAAYLVPAAACSVNSTPSRSAPGRHAPGHRSPHTG